MLFQEFIIGMNEPTASSMLDIQNMYAWTWMHTHSRTHLYLNGGFASHSCIHPSAYWGMCKGTCSVHEYCILLALVVFDSSNNSPLVKYIKTQLEVLHCTMRYMYVCVWTFHNNYFGNCCNYRDWVCACVCYSINSLVSADGGQIGFYDFFI